MSEASQSQKKTFPVRMILVGGLAVVLMVALMMAYATKNRATRALKPAIARYGMVGDFSLIDQKNQPYDSKRLAGKVWVANFIFTSCGIECPLLSRRMQDIQAAFKNDPRVELVSISVDPRTDSPERLAAYAGVFEAGERWAFLTGDTREIEKLTTKGFMVAAPGETPATSSVRRTRELLHSQKIAVVDQLGVVRFFANGMNPTSSREISEVVRTLLRTES